MCMWSGADCFFNLFFLSVLSLFYYLRGCHVLLIPKGGSNSSTSCLTTIKDEQQQASNYQGSANEVLWSLTLLPWWLCGWRSLHTVMLKQALVSRERNRVFIWYWQGHLNTEPVFVPPLWRSHIIWVQNHSVSELQRDSVILRDWEFVLSAFI